MTVAKWSYDELMALLPAVSRLDQEERLALVRRALLFHVDLAIAHRTSNGYGLPVQDGSFDLFVDGMRSGETGRTFHWTFARRLIERLPRGEERARVARAFYLATGALLLWWADHVELDAHLSDAQRIVGQDPAFLLYEGMRHQIYAHPRAEEYLNERRRALALGPRGRIPPVLPSIARSRADAERAFRRAIQLDEGQHEAHVRLAHVLADRGRHEDALNQVGKVPIDVEPPLLAYYALIVRGRSERALGRLVPATTTFEQALDLFPEAQVPRLALSEIAIGMGDRALARSHAESMAFENEPWHLLVRMYTLLDVRLREMREVLA